MYLSMPKITDNTVCFTEPAILQPIPLIVLQLQKSGHVCQIGYFKSLTREYRLVFKLYYSVFLRKMMVQ